MNWFGTIIASITVGAVMSHAYFVLMHDLTHYTCFESKPLNQLAAIFGNFSQGVPSAVGFGRYHRDHHTYLGVPNGGDYDLPTEWEVSFFKTPLRKIIFIIVLPFFYSLRPYFVRPKKPVPMELLNIALVVTWDYLIFQNFGGKGLAYLILSTFSGLGINPCAIHIIAEHYEFVKG